MDRESAGRGRKGIASMTIEEREKELLEIIPTEYQPLLREEVHIIATLEESIRKIEKLPRLVSMKGTPEKQKTLPAGKHYKDTVNLYISTISQITRIIGKSSPKTAEDDPFIEALKFGDDADEDDVS